MALVEFLGETAIKHDKHEVSISSLSGEGKVVGLYFSAHWCPPCRSFTPQFAEWYTNFKKSANGDKLEVLFVSSDKDEDSFQSYFKEMPWLAFSYEKRDLKEKLSKKYKVTGIPTLVFLDAATGKVNEADGRTVVIDDPKGEEFPWAAQPFKDVFRGALVGKDEKELHTDDVAGKVLGLYFSAHWCGPCRGFTPSLIKSYNQIKKDGKNLEIIFCSSDRDADGFKSYYADMPWLALPFGDPRKRLLSKMFDVQGIPMLVFLDENGKVITTNGRAVIEGDPEGKEFPFIPKPANMLSGSSARSINDNVTLIWFAANSTQSKTFLQTLMPVAKDIHDAATSKDDSPPMDFLVACQDDDNDDIMDGLFEFTKLTLTEIPFIAILDVPSQTVYKDYSIKEYTTDSLTTLVADYLADKLTSTKIR